MTMPGEEGLLRQAAYTLPTHITNPEVGSNEDQRQAADFAELHSDLVTRLRREHTEGRPSTLMEMMIERCASAFVLTKWAENTGRLDDQRMRKEVNNTFIAMCENVRRLDRDAKGEDDIRRQYTDAFMRAVENLTASVDEETIAQFRGLMADELERIGL